jgi:nucleoside-diphosphate-sugar epimerase
MRILITGSEGLLGKLSREALKENELVLIDKNARNSVNLLKEDINRNFIGVEIVIHLAANSNPRQDRKFAEENILMTWNVLEACKDAGVKRMVYSSSINVYDVEDIYNTNKKIEPTTPVSPHRKTQWVSGKGGVFYPLSKILCENLIESYHQLYGISGLILRLGWVASDSPAIPEEVFDSAIWLSQEDFKEIIKRGITFDGLERLTCTSNNSEQFVDLKPIEDVLSYIPKSNSEVFRTK